MFDLVADFRNVPFVPSPPFSPSTCSIVTSFMLDTLEGTNSSCVISNISYFATKLALGVQLGTLPSIGGPLTSLFTLSFESVDFPTSSCKQDVPIARTTNGEIEFQGTGWSGMLNSTPGLKAGDRIAFLATPLAHGFSISVPIATYFSVYYSAVGGNPEMNSTKPIRWTKWASKTVNCSDSISPVIATFRPYPVIQAIYLQKGSRGAQGEPSVGQNLLVDGGAEGKSINNYWGKETNPSTTSSTSIVSIGGSGRNSEFCYVINVTKAANAIEYIGIRNHRFDAVLLSDETYEIPLFFLQPLMVSV